MVIGVAATASATATGSESERFRHARGVTSERKHKMNRVSVCFIISYPCHVGEGLTAELSVFNVIAPDRDRRRPAGRPAASGRCPAEPRRWGDDGQLHAAALQWQS